MEQQLPALDTVMTMLLLVAIVISVGRARGRFGIRAPAMTGPPEFERIVRVHANTIENTVLFLPCLWLCVPYFGALWPGLIGLVWVLARAWYALAYGSGGNRSPGFTIASIANTVLLLGALFGVLRAMWILASVPAAA
jgi:hypothetical protein